MSTAFSHKRDGKDTIFLDTEQIFWRIFCGKDKKGHIIRGYGSLGQAKFQNQNVANMEVLNFVLGQT